MAENFSAARQGSVLFDRLISDAELDRPLSVDSILIYLIEQNVLNPDDKLGVLNRAFNRATIQLTAGSPSKQQLVRESLRLKIAVYLNEAYAAVCEEIFEQDEAENRQLQQWHQHQQSRFADDHSSEEYAEYLRETEAYDRQMWLERRQVMIYDPTWVQAFNISERK